MKRLTLFSSLLAIYLLSLATGLAAVPEKLEFDGVTFSKAFSDKSASGPFSEYLPKGQSLETWTKLMGYYQFTKLDNVEAAVARMSEVVKEMNPQAQAEVIYNESTDEGVVDFITWPKDGAYVEFNVWKYRKAAGGGLVALQYAERAYGADATGYLKKLGKRRIAMRDAMIKQAW